MTYILDNVNVFRGENTSISSILVKDNRIDYISEKLEKFRYYRTDLSQFLLTPGYIMLDYSLSKPHSFSKYKEIMVEQYLSKGCTSLLVIAEVSHERTLKQIIEETKQHMLSSPIDYYIGIKIPLKALTPSLIRACKRLKVPAVIVEIEKVEDVIQLPWGWIRDALYFYQLPIIPKWNRKEKTFFQGNRQEDIWIEIMRDNRIPTIPYCPKESEPLSKEVLKKIGIFPNKGDIRIGGMLDYNLFELSEIGYSVEQKPLLDYHKHIPKITMHNGKYTKIGSEIHFHSGFGNECKVKVPGYFVSSF